MESNSSKVKSFFTSTLHRKIPVLKYQVNDDMSVTKIGGFCRTPSPDGLAIDSNGNLWIANTNGNRTVTVLTQQVLNLAVSVSMVSRVFRIVPWWFGQKTLYHRKLQFSVLEPLWLEEVPQVRFREGYRKWQRKGAEGKHFTNKGNAS